MSTSQVISLRPPRYELRSLKNRRCVWDDSQITTNREYSRPSRQAVVSARANSNNSFSTRPPPISDCYFVKLFSVICCVIVHKQQYLAYAITCPVIYFFARLRLLNVVLHEMPMHSMRYKHYLSISFVAANDPTALFSLVYRQLAWRGCSVMVKLAID